MNKRKHPTTLKSYGGEERRIQGFWWGNLRETDHLGDQSIDGRITLRWVFMK
jgi:hypothetical protein